MPHLLNVLIINMQHAIAAVSAETEELVPAAVSEAPSGVKPTCKNRTCFLHAPLSSVTNDFFFSFETD